MQKEIYYVTTNDGKFEEVADFIQRNEPQIKLKQFKTDIPEIQILDQKAIAIDKAKKAWNIIKKPLLIDDAAIYFEKYNNFPGTLTKHVAQGIGFEGIKKLIDSEDKATLLLHMVYIDTPEKVTIFEGKSEGTLIKPEKFSGNPNLPFGCFFIPNGSTKTLTQMKKTKEGDKYNHRLKALKEFLKWWKERK